MESNKRPRSTDEGSSHMVKTRTLKMMIGSAYIPKRNESKPLGDDAHFICHEHQTFGVADGVGGWASRGIDAGKYARKLMKNTISAVRDQCISADINPKKMLQQGFSNTFARGSSTACVITLRHDNILHCINVGDSGFVVIREGQITYRSPVQQRGYNCPYQLAVKGANVPNDGDEIGIDVQAWDIIVAGTDGLFDNVFEYELEEMVGSGLDEKKTATALAERIAKYALDRAEDVLSISPFEEAAKAAGRQHEGGKYDDITVVVAYVFPSKYFN